MSIWSSIYQLSVKHYHDDKHLSQFYLQDGGKNSLGIDMEQNYATVTHMYRQVYQTKREAYRAYAVGPTRRSLRLNCEVYLRFYFQKEVEIMKTSDAGNLFFVVASLAASLSRILHTATNTGNGCGCGRSFTAKLRPFEEQVSSLIGQLTCRGIGTGRVLDTNIYTPV